MSRFGWAYVSSIVSGAAVIGPDRGVVLNEGGYASSSAYLSSIGSTVSLNGQFNVTGNVNINGTLFANEYQTTLVSSSIIYSSGSTKFGNDLLDTHQFTGSVFVTGVVSASTGLQSAGPIISNSIISSSLGFETNTTVQAVGNIRSSNGDISSSLNLQTGGFLTVAGAATIRSGLTVTGSSFVQALSSSGQIQATSLRGDGLNITGIQGTNVSAVGNDYSIQFKNVSTGALTGSANLLYNNNNTLQISASAIVYPTSIRTGSFTVGSAEYFIFVSGTAVTASFGSASNGRVIRIYNYGADTILFNTASAPVNGFIGSGGTNVATIIQGTNPRTTELMYFTTNNRWLVISTGN